jgi:hypothetical protein
MLYFGGQTWAGRWNSLVEIDLGSPWTPLPRRTEKTNICENFNVTLATSRIDDDANL